jgi:hypothetical protein
MVRNWTAAWRAAPLIALAACSSAADAEATQRAVEGAVDSFFVSIFQWFLVLFVFAILAVVVWSLVIGGAAAAIFAGTRRLKGEQTERTQRDAVAVGMLVFGIVLLLSSAGAVCSITSGPTGAEVSIPVPIVLLGAGLIFAAKRRTARRGGRRREHEKV